MLGLARENVDYLRKKILGKWTWIFLACVISLALLYGVLVEPQQVRFVRISIKNRRLASVLQGIKAVHISDLHLGSAPSLPAQKVMRLLQYIKPDVIFLTGDYVQWHGGRRAYDQALAFLGQLEAPLGVYAVMGDADYTDSRKSCEFCHEISNFSSPVEDRHVTFLRNSWRRVSAGSGSFIVAGIDNEKRDDQSKILPEGLPQDLPLIILSHSSVVYYAVDDTTDALMLSGDTHGGQILLPRLFWQLSGLKPDPLHMYGLFRDGRKTLYVTSGVGTSEVPIRLGVPPEIAVLEFEQ